MEAVHQAWETVPSLYRDRLRIWNVESDPFMNLSQQFVSCLCHTLRLTLFFLTKAEQKSPPFVLEDLSGVKGSFTSSCVWCLNKYVLLSQVGYATTGPWSL